MSRPMIPIQMADAEYNGFSIRFRPLTLSDFLLLIDTHQALLTEVLPNFRQETSTGPPEEPQIAQLRLMAQLEPVLLHAIAIAAGVPDDADAFTSLPALVLIQFWETVRLLSLGTESAESLIHLVKASVADLSSAGSTVH